MNKRFLSFSLMHGGFLLYSFYTVLGKFASRYEFLSLFWCGIYASLILILFAYALIWQQVLKNWQLSIAMANKAATIIWGMIWGVVFFGEEISVKKIIGALLIFCGIFLLNFTGDSKNE